MKKPQRMTAPVRRITVDERLFDDLIRLEVCDLTNGVERFEDAPRYWKDENEDDEDVLVRPNDYADVMGIPQEQRDDWPWKDLTEGQVFLSGAFEELANKKDTGWYAVVPNRRGFIRIDEITRKDTAKLYNEAIKRSG